MGRRGRPEVLDTVKQVQVTAIVGVGCSQALAADYVGCASSTIQRTADREPAFGKALRKAKGNSELSLVNCIRNAAKQPKYWRAAAWALERGFPDKYGCRGPDVITVEQIDVLIARFSEIIVHEVSVQARKRILKQVGLLARSFGCELKKEPSDDSR
jgi:hypothetical protein